jgi:hypothetical protein
LLLALAAYLVIELRLARSQAPPATVGLYLWVGALALFIGAARLPGPLWGPILLSLAALGATTWSRRPGRAVLATQAALFLLAAAALSGLLGGIAQAFFGDARQAGANLFSVGNIIVLVASLLSWSWSSRPPDPEAQPWWSRLPGLLLLGLVAAGLGALLVQLLGGPVAAAGQASADAGALAVLRTAVLAVSVAAFALLGRRPSRRDLRSLASAALVFAFVKLVLDDLPHGRPGTLFLSLALLGAALISVTWARRDRAGPSPKGGPGQ